jgi:hypothetical protein
VFLHRNSFWQTAVSINLIDHSPTQRHVDVCAKKDTAASVVIHKQIK